MDKDLDFNSAHSMGTTIIGVTYNGGVVLDADYRTSTGIYVTNRVSDKITKITDNVYELLALEERIGNVCTGLSQETISSRMKQRKYIQDTMNNDQTEPEPCCVCQDLACSTMETKTKTKIARKALANVNNIQGNASRLTKPGGSRNSAVFGIVTSTASSSRPLAVRILALNASYFLKAGDHFVISIKANCIDSTVPAEAVFASEVKKLQQDRCKPMEQVTLEPFERDHVCVVGGYRVPKKQKTGDK